MPAEPKRTVKLPHNIIMENRKKTDDYRGV